MPSKQQKKVDKAEQREIEKQKQLQDLKEDQQWEKGTNKRGLRKLQQQTEKQEEKMRNAKEMKELLTAEEESLGSGRKSKTRNKKGDDFELLKTLATLPKSKAQKEKEEKLRKKEEQRKIEEQQKIEKQELIQKQEQEENKLQQKGIVTNSDIYIPNENNNEEFSYANSIDNALEILNENDEDPKIKDIFKEFYKTQFQLLKEENPGLRLNQYKERIYKLWKKSPENPYSNK
tara:strand:- start:1012 stop:1707 length:696 start_codon:yes stop_codon:yes gene_type:complete